MSVVKYTEDIFISYAHIDNEPLIKGEEGWVSQFHHSLKARVGMLLGRQSSVWRDPKLQGNDHLDDAIIERIENVATLVSIFTPRYVRSEWCTRELIQFCEAAEKSGGLRVLDKAKIFKVIKTPVPLDEHPEQVRDCVGYQFFKYDPATGRPREFDYGLDSDTRREYFTKLDDLACDLCELLKWLEQESPADLPDELPKKKDTVFVADCSADVIEQCDEVRRDLTGHDYRILPGGPLPLHVDELMPALEESLEQSRMSIHLIGSSYGIVPEGTDRSIIELQNEAAIEREKQGGFCRIVWIPPGLETDDPRQQRFIASLRSDPRIQEGADLLETPLEDLKTQIHKTLARESGSDTAAGSRASDASDDIKHVYLMCDSRDSDKVTPVADYLFDRGCEVTLPAFQGDAAAVRADNEANLRDADGVLIYYGAPNELWLRGKLREQRKSAGLGRTKPIKAKAILVAPPNSQREKWLRTHEARVIRQPHEFSAELLDPFLADLRH